VIIHLATPAEWADAEASGEVAPPSLAAEGFIHCSRLEQVPSTIERHFEGVDELVLLHLDPHGFGDDLRWEEGRPGEDFPHVYRAIRVDEVQAVEPWTREAPGS
jgi:uncharacterized protein (DUF952 family)